MQIAREASIAEHRLAGIKYNRIFIAEYQGRQAGLLELKFKGDK